MYDACPKCGGRLFCDVEMINQYIPVRWKDKVDSIPSKTSNLYFRCVRCHHLMHFEILRTEFSEESKSVNEN